MVHVVWLTVVGDVKDEALLENVFGGHKPQVVSHAAAHKHVPLMETNPQEAIKNNTLGTYNLVAAATRHGAERFLYISTDKAVRPSSVMGATKRLGGGGARARRGERHEVHRCGSGCAGQLRQRGAHRSRYWRAGR